MSEAIVPLSQATKKALEKYGEWEANPFACLPEDWIPAVAFFAMEKGKLIGPSPLAFCLKVKLYREKGLTLTGLKAIMQRLTDPEVEAKHNFDNQLLTDFAGLAAQVIRAQKRVNEKRAREAAADADGGNGQRVILSFADATKLPPSDSRSSAEILKGRRA